MEADKPFDSTALADTVLRSLDNVHFYVLGAFLRYVSPTFRDMFSLNQGSAADENEIKHGYPVIPLQEDGETIQCLLNIIYPYINKPRFDNSHLLIKVYKMAEKYGMDTITGKLRKHLCNDRWMKEQPHRVFAIAIILGWDDGVTMAKQALFLWEQVPYCEEFENITGTDYYGLVEYRLHHAEDPEEPAEQLQAHHGGDDVSVGAEDNPPADFHDSNSFERGAQETPEPFKSSAEADVILHSLDAVDFYVSRSFLGLISSNFADMLSVTEGDGPVTVPVNSEALRQFLLMLYHRIDEPPIENLTLIADICIMARKYGVATIEARLKKQLAASSVLIENPLRVYAIGTYLGWADVAKSAAKNTLNAPVADMVTRVSELQRITGADLHRLLSYREKCVEAASGIVENSEMHRSYGPGCIASKLHRAYGRNTLQFCGFPKDAKRSNNVEDDLEACPRGSTYTNIFTLLIDVFGGPVYENHYWSVPSVIGFLRCCRDVAEAIEKEIEKVSLDSGTVY